MNRQQRRAAEASARRSKLVIIADDLRTHRRVESEIRSTPGFSLWARSEDNKSHPSAWVLLGTYDSLTDLEISQREARKKFHHDDQAVYDDANARDLPESVTEFLTVWGDNAEFAATEAGGDMKSPEKNFAYAQVLGHEWDWGVAVCLKAVAFYYGLHPDIPGKRTIWPVGSTCGHATARVVE